MDCQRTVDLKDEMNFASIAGKVDLETSTAVSVLEESRSSDQNRNIESTNRTLNEALDETVEGLFAAFKQTGQMLPELPKDLPPKKTIENMCIEKLVKKWYKNLFY